MSGPENPDDWKSQHFRRRVRNKIEEVIRRSGNPTNKTVPELENSVFAKAQTREDYLHFAARLIHYLEDKNLNRREQPGLQRGLQQRSMIQGIPNNNLAGSQNTVDIQGVGQMNAVPVLQDESGIIVVPVSGAPMTMSVQANAVPQMQQITINQEGKQITMNPGGQQMTMNEGGPHMMQRVGMPLNRMVGGQMLIPNAPPNVQVPVSHLNQRLPVMANIQMIQRMRRPSNQGGGDQMFYQGRPQPGSMHSQQFQPTLGSTYQQNAGMMMQNQNPGMVLHHPPMNQLSGPSAMVPSPSSYIPSPSQGLMLSPMSAGIMDLSTPMSVASTPSPSSLNTPVMMQTQSPASGPVNDGQAYFDKLRQLSKFIEPLSKMTTRIDRDESMPNERKKGLHKINNLLAIISGSQKCSMETLLKCEHVLEQMEFKFSTVEPFAVVGATPNALGLAKQQDHNIGQPLSDAVMNNIRKPFFNHTLHRTIGPAVAAMTTYTSSPPVKRKRNQEHPEVPEVLQGEIARLEQRFKIQIDALQHPGSKTISLICRLDDKKLPCVPPISVIVPESYPFKPPQCSPDDDEEYNVSPFLQEIHKSFNASVTKLSNNYSITTLLNIWEKSVRQACTKEIDHSMNSANHE